MVLGHRECEGLASPVDGRRAFEAYGGFGLEVLPGRDGGW